MKYTTESKVEEYFKTLDTDVVVGKTYYTRSVSAGA